MLVPKGEGAHPLKLRPLSVLSLIYRAWGGIRVAEAMPRQEQWIHLQAYAYRRHQSSTDAALLIGTMLEHARIMSKSIAGAATDYAKCFDLILQQISLEVAKKKGMYQGIIIAMAGMYKDLRRGSTR